MRLIYTDNKFMEPPDHCLKPQNGTFVNGEYIPNKPRNSNHGTANETEKDDVLDEEYSLFNSIQ